MYNEPLAMAQRSLYKIKMVKEHAGFQTEKNTSNLQTVV
jgi:hypothetical protein